MVLVISQETFDQAVQENINDLGLSHEDAVVEAIHQFELQGVDLSQIIKDLGSKSDFHKISKVIRKLRAQEKNLTSECVDLLNALKVECDKGIPYRVQAGHEGAYNVLLDIFLISQAGKDIQVGVIKAMVALMTKQPDLLDERGKLVIVSSLEKTDDQELQKFVLKWCKECCIMHEMNRQGLVELNIVKYLTKLLQEANPYILKDILVLLRALTLDDDVRVEYGKAHEHARIIATETLMILMKLLHSLKNDESLINDLVVTISSLLVKNEFCRQVEEGGGIELINEIMTTYMNNDKVIRQCFKMIKSLSGNDGCKAHIIQKGLAPIINKALNIHQNSVQTSVAGLNCVAALCLRSPDNSRALFDAEVPDVIVDIMKKHRDEKSVQRTASWAIRNMVSRSRYQNEHFLQLGVEDLLTENLTKFKEFEYDTKAALRDLECNVELREEWTGKGGRITSSRLSLF